MCSVIVITISKPNQSKCLAQSLRWTWKNTMINNLPMIVTKILIHLLLQSNHQKRKGTLGSWFLTLRLWKKKNRQVFSTIKRKSWNWRKRMRNLSFNSLPSRAIKENWTPFIKTKKKFANRFTSLENWYPSNSIRIYSWSRNLKVFNMER